MIIRSSRVRVLTRRGLREDETRWRFGLPGVCDTGDPNGPVEACPLNTHYEQLLSGLPPELIEKHRRKGNMMKWREMLNADRPKRDATGIHDPCDLICPDLPKVL